MTTFYGQIVVVLLILSITHVFATFIRRLVHSKFPQRHPIIHMTRTQRVMSQHFLTALIYLIGIGISIYIIPSLRSLSISLFASAGVLAIVVGFASQQAISQVIGGVFIAIFAPFRVGDLIKVKGDLGFVEDITLRHSILRTFENKHVIIPNSTITNETLINYTINDEKICQFIEVHISYDSSFELAKKILIEEASKHPNSIDIRSEEDKKKKIPKIKVKLLELTDSSQHIRAWVWARNPILARHMNWDVLERVKARFDAEGIEIPYPHRTIVYQKDLKKPAKKKRVVKTRTVKKKAASTKKTKSK